MSISAAKVKELRDSSGAGMMDAKKALVETNGDMEAAVDWLRTKGLAKAEKKSGRTAAEGLVSIKILGKTGVIVEVNSETDFVAKNEKFQKLVSIITDCALSCDNLDELLKASTGDKTVNDLVADNVAKIGENMNVRRLSHLRGDNLCFYVHNAVTETMGKIGVLVAFTGTDSNTCRQIAMHIAATNPASLSEADLSSELVEREKAILTEQAKESGKPDSIIENMIRGRMKKYYEEVTLLNQKFVINPDVTVGDALNSAGLEVTGFIRIEVGEGIEKANEDFASEVEKTINS